MENKHTLFHGTDYMKMFCESLGEHAKNKIDFEKKKMLPLIKEELKSQKSKIIVITQVNIEAHSTGKLKFIVPNEILVAFHRGSNYDCHFIIKELANKFEGKFECFGENKEKYETFLFQ